MSGGHLLSDHRIDDKLYKLFGWHLPGQQRICKLFKLYGGDLSAFNGFDGMSRVPRRQIPFNNWDINCSKLLFMLDRHIPAKFSIVQLCEV